MANENELNLEETLPTPPVAGEAQEDPAVQAAPLPDDAKEELPADDAEQAGDKSEDTAGFPPFGGADDAPVDDAPDAPAADEEAPSEDAAADAGDFESPPFNPALENLPGDVAVDAPADDAASADAGDEQAPAEEAPVQEVPGVEEPVVEAAPEASEGGDVHVEPPFQDKPEEAPAEAPVDAPAEDAPTDAAPVDATPTDAGTAPVSPATDASGEPILDTGTPALPVPTSPVTEHPAPSSGGMADPCTGLPIELPKDGDNASSDAGAGEVEAAQKAIDEAQAKLKDVTAKFKEKSSSILASIRADLQALEGILKGGL